MDQLTPPADRQIVHGTAKYWQYLACHHFPATCAQAHSPYLCHTGWAQNQAHAAVDQPIDSNACGIHQIITCVSKQLHSPLDWHLPVNAAHQACGGLCVVHTHEWSTHKHRTDFGHDVSTHKYSWLDTQGTMQPAPQPQNLHSREPDIPPGFWPASVSHVLHGCHAMQPKHS